MKIDRFSIKVKSVSYGCEDISLFFNDQEIYFFASYMGYEPVTTLIKSLVWLERDVEGVDYMTTSFEWLDEPGSLKFDLRKDLQEDHILIRIKYDNCVDDSLYHREKDWCFEMPYSLYRQTVLDTALRVLKEYGLNGFNESWADDPDTFSICSLISLLGNELSYHEEGDNFHSDLMGEFKLLAKKMEEITDLPIFV